MLINDLLRRVAESEFRHTTHQQPPRREQIDMGEVDAGSFGRLRVRHDIAHGELSIAGVTSDVADLAPDLRDVFLGASSDYVDSLEDIGLQAPAKVTVGGLVAAILSRRGYIADGVRRAKVKQRYGA